MPRQPSDRAKLLHAVINGILADYEEIARLEDICARIVRKREMASEATPTSSDDEDDSKY